MRVFAPFLQRRAFRRIKVSNPSILEERLPHLAFLLRVMQGNPWTFCQAGQNGEREGELLHRKEGIDLEISQAFEQVNLDRLEVIYLYGVGLGHYAKALLEWLSRDVKRDLVLIEDDLEVLRLLLQTEGAHMLIDHPQIHLRVMVDPKLWKRFLEERAAEFPYERSDLIPLEHYKKRRPERVREMRLHLLRKVTVWDAIHKEDLYHFVLSKNVLSNFSKIGKAFYANRLKDAFQGIPAVICGAGPSLKGELTVLRRLEERALIFAGGSAVTGLNHLKVSPHFCVAVDPSVEEAHRFEKRGTLKTPLLYTNRLHPAVFKMCHGPLGYIHTKTGGPLEAFWEKELGIEPLPLKGGFDIEALSVTTVCLELATTMGCNPIYLVGVDLAFTNNRIYTEGVVETDLLSSFKLSDEARSSEQPLLRKDRHGKQVYTLVKWIMESETISRFVESHPHTTYINSTSGGIGFPNLPYQKLCFERFEKKVDLRGKIETLIRENRFSFEKRDPLEKLDRSLKRGREIACQALDEIRRIKGRSKPEKNGRLIFLQMEFESLLAYSVCLKQEARAFRKVFERMHRIQPSDWTCQDEWEYLYAKWKGFDSLITEYLVTLQNSSDPIY